MTAFREVGKSSEAQKKQLGTQHRTQKGCGLKLRARYKIFQFSIIMLFGFVLLPQENGRNRDFISDTRPYTSFLDSSTNLLSDPGSGIRQLIARVLMVFSSFASSDGFRET